MEKIIAYFKNDSIKDIISVLREECEVTYVNSLYDLLGEITQVSYDVSILDLPEEKDFEIIPNIHSIDPKLPVIATSSDISIEAQKRLRSYGLFYFFTFPIDIEELKKAIRDAAKFSQKERSREEMAMACNLRDKNVAEESTQKNRKVSRRSFLDYLIGGSVSAMVLAGIGVVISYFYPRGSHGIKPFGTMVGYLKDLPVGSGKTIPYKDKAAIIINTTDGLVAYSALCTHLCCLVEWDKTSGLIACPCHNGKFDAEGSVISGPPFRPLIPYKVEVIGEKIYLWDV